MSLDDDPGRRYIATACNVCKLTPPAVKLSFCSGCRRFQYCGAEHQKEDHAAHKVYCKRLQAFDAELPNAVNDGRVALPVSGDEKGWQQYRLECLQLYRSLAQGEGEDAPLQQEEGPEVYSLLFPRICASCYTMAELVDCPECQMCSWCPRCAEEVQAKHKHLCESFIILLRAEQLLREEAARSGIPALVYVPELPETSPAPLERDWAGYFKRRKVPALVAPALVLVTDVLTTPLTILWGLEKLVSGVREMEYLSIHVLGAEIPKEMLAVSKYEELLHLLPRAKHVDIALVGPSLPDEMPNFNCDLCAECSKGERKLRLSIHGTAYHVFRAEAGPGSAPHLAVALNSGCHAGVGKTLDPWEETLKFLGRQGTRVLFTSLNRAEGEQDEATLRAAGVQVTVPSMKNPYRSLAPVREPDMMALPPPEALETTFFCNNNYLCAARGAGPDAEAVPSPAESRPPPASGGGGGAERGAGIGLGAEGIRAMPAPQAWYGDDAPGGFGGAL